jgi:hypothetical protein
LSTPSYLIRNRRDDLASNLIRIADGGGEGFEAAYSSLSDISSVTKQISKENGLVSKVFRAMIQYTVGVEI